MLGTFFTTKLPKVTAKKNGHRKFGPNFFFAEIVQHPEGLGCTRSGPPRHIWHRKASHRVKMVTIPSIQPI